MSKYKKCTVCNTTRPLRKFHKNAGYKDGRFNECSDCRTEKRRQERERKRNEINIETGLFSVEEQRKIWYYGKQHASKPVSQGLGKNDLIRFIPRKKTQRI